MVKKTMKKNVLCYLSEVGHNNFYYATNTKVIIKEIENQTKKLALALKVKGFMNVQYAA